MIKGVITAAIMTWGINTAKYTGRVAPDTMQNKKMVSFAAVPV